LRKCAISLRKKDLHMRFSRAIKVPVAAVLTATLMLSVAVVVSADTAKARWQGAGQVLYVGPSLDPGAPTSSSAEFRFGRDGSIKHATITTRNEAVAGILGGGNGGGAVTECEDRTHGATCELLNELLSGAAISSLHDSIARLTNVSPDVIQIPVETPNGVVLADFSILRGDLSGRIDGVFTIGQGGDKATGQVNLRITRGGTGAYACFLPGPTGSPAPVPSLGPCVQDAGGQLLPIALEVVDRGKFELGQGEGALEQVRSLKGTVQVAVQADLLSQNFGGTVTISNATAELIGDFAAARGVESDAAHQEHRRDRAGITDRVEDRLTAIRNRD
jgi:hypothetical protein